MAASTVDHIHTHLRNAVLLVWGSLRLAPINNFPFLHKCGALSGSPQICKPQKKIRPHARTGARLSRVERRQHTIYVALHETVGKTVFYQAKTATI